ncbi:MAG: hypothetical protein DRH90_09380 [Deltaproteobacteria bacterium]|nr:MAG: hypothetical protein DRH90_09380 [Deltaproteobacteria bacterium]RLC18862.1 MAG: hypothetical protein DRI24_01805 [Deltaproteobacteria bacterium]HHE74267.1 hypothetical protein [Desulfobacteraceae bacterium]
MPFVTLPDIKGKIYVPEQNALSLKKHSCGNCFSCRMCSDDRCRICLSKATGEQSDSDQVQGE